MSVSGTVASGMGRGRIFMSAKEYKDQFAKALGINSFDGTFNIRVSEKEVSELKAIKGIRIEGFERDGRSFGGLTAFHATISGMKCALVIPDRSAHTNVIELIADRNLRESLGLKDGDHVSVEITTQ